MKNKKIKFTIKELREGLEESPFIQLDLKRERNVPTKPLRDALYGLNNADDFIRILPEEESPLALPVYAIRAWLQAVTADCVYIRLDLETMILHVSYTEDGIKGRAQFKTAEPYVSDKGIIVTDTGFDTPAPVIAEKTPAQVWIDKAVSKDPHRAQWLQSNAGELSADAFRIHRVVNGKYQDGELLNQLNSINLLNAPNENMAIADADELRKAVRSAMKQNKETIRLYVNGTLEISTDNDNGRMQTTLKKYEHQGENITMLFNPRYLMDALSIMEGEIVMSMKESVSPLYISDGSFEAVIMAKKES